MEVFDIEYLQTGLAGELFGILPMVKITGLVMRRCGMGNEPLPRAWESLLNSASSMPVIVKSIESFFNVGWPMQPSRHEFFEMVYVKSGQAVFEIEGQPVKICPNDILIIKPFQSHKLIVEKEPGCRFIVLSFKFENRMDSRYSQVSINDFLNFVKGDETGAYLTLKADRKNGIVSLLDRILEEKAGNELGSEFLRHLLVMQLFVLISRELKKEWEESMTARTSRLNELIEASIRYMESNYENDITLSDIAGYVFLSASYFVRVFRAHTGMAPITYLTKMRVDRAKKLLTDTERKIGDIALSVGFSSHQRFNAAFRKHTGLSPNQYRKTAGYMSTNVKN